MREVSVRKGQVDEADKMAQVRANTGVRDVSFLQGHLALHRSSITRICVTACGVVGVGEGPMGASSDTENDEASKFLCGNCLIYILPRQY